jgi:molybdenum cofactor biosynthesis enzyme MoaA
MDTAVTSGKGQQNSSTLTESNETSTTSPVVARGSSNLTPWPKQKSDDVASGWRLSDSFLKYSNLFAKAKLFLYLAMRGRNLSRPYYAHYQITRRCNFSCPSCQTWQDPVFAKGLSIDEIKILAKNLKKIGVKSLAVTGGEATLRKDIVDVVKIFKKEGLLIRFHTNGFLLTEGLMERLFRAGAADVYISLDSLNSETFNVINGMTRPGTYERVLENIEMVAKMSKRFGGNLFLNTVLRRDNVMEANALHEFSKSINSLIAFYALEVADENDELNLRACDPDLLPTEEDSSRLIKTFAGLIKLKQTKNNNIFMSKWMMKEYERFYNDPNFDMHWKCNAGKYYLEVLPEGTISVCNATPAIPGFNFKNLTELYSRKDREDIFNKYRTTCSGCICTRQLEQIASNPSDLFDKARVYLASVFK